MSITYDKSTDFTSKDSMATTNPDKVLSGVPFDFEFDAISAAFEQAAPTLDATFTGTTTTDILVATTVNGSTTTNWDTAYGWGDHSEEGYITAFSEEDPTVPAHVKAITETNISDWESAHVIADRLDLKEEVWDATTAVVVDKELIWDAKVEEVPNAIPDAQYARVNGGWGVVEEGASSSLTQGQIDGFIDASAWVVDHGGNADEWDEAHLWGNHASEGYAKTASLPTKLSQFDNDGVFITSEALPTKVGDLFNDKGYITEADIPDVDLTPYAKKTEAVLKTGSQTVAGRKTFQDKIYGNLQGKADEATQADSATTADSATLAETANKCNRSVSAGTNLSGGGTLTSNRTINLDSTLTNLTSVQASTVDSETVTVGVFTITTRSGGFLEIKIGSTKLFDLNSDGDLRVKGDVTAFTTGL
jgi:hypothetical protein